VGGFGSDPGRATRPTTSNFGPDSYEFAKDKPITLLDGSNLLHMLGRHGTKAYIDIKEARAIWQ